MASLSPDSHMHCCPQGVCAVTVNLLHEKDSVSSQYLPRQLCNNSIVHFHSGRGLEFLLLEARHPDWELQRWLGEGACLMEGSKQGRGLGNPHSVGQANAAAMPPWKRWQCGTELWKRASSSGTSRNPVCRMTLWRRITKIHIHPTWRTQEVNFDCGQGFNKAWDQLRPFSYP